MPEVLGHGEASEIERLCELKLVDLGESDSASRASSLNARLRLGVNVAPRLRELGEWSTRPYDLRPTGMKIQRAGARR